MLVKLKRRSKLFTLSVLLLEDYFLFDSFEKKKTALFTLSAVSLYSRLNISLFDCRTTESPDPNRVAISHDWEIETKRVGRRSDLSQRRELK